MQGGGSVGVPRGVVFAMAEVRTHESVLAERRGGGRTCPSLAKSTLAGRTSHWDPEDIQVGALKKDEKEGVAAMWTSVFDDIAGEDDSPVVGGQFARFVLWVSLAVDAKQLRAPAASAGIACIRLVCRDPQFFRWS